MTEWHYRWVERHYQKPGWQVELIDGNHRFDCFNESKHLVVEIQKASRYEYIIEKTRGTFQRGYRINWVFHIDMLSSLTMTDDRFLATGRRRLVILDVLQELSTLEGVNFYVDILANKSNGKSSKGLLHLQPVNKMYATYNDYYEIPYSKYANEA